MGRLSLCYSTLLGVVGLLLRGHCPVFRNLLVAYARTKRRRPKGPSFYAEKLRRTNPNWAGLIERVRELWNVYVKGSLVGEQYPQGSFGPSVFVAPARAAAIVLASLETLFLECVLGMDDINAFAARRRLREHNVFLLRALNEEEQRCIGPPRARHLSSRNSVDRCEHRELVLWNVVHGEAFRKQYSVEVTTTNLRELYLAWLDSAALTLGGRAYCKRLEDAVWSEQCLQFAWSKNLFSKSWKAVLDKWYAAWEERYDDDTFLTMWCGYGRVGGYGGKYEGGDRREGRGGRGEVFVMGEGGGDARVGECWDRLTLPCRHVKVPLFPRIG